MLARFLAVALLVPFLAPPASAQKAPLRLDLNIPALRLVVYEGNTPIRSYPVAVGMPGHDTPTGDFTISRAEWNPWWRPPEREWAKGEKVTPPGPQNPMGRVKLFFAPYYFIHGTPASESIGTPASHGCVRMLSKDVIALARLLHERAAPAVTSAQIDRILAHPRDTRGVRFDDSIPLRIHYDPIVVEKGVVRVYPDYYGYRAVHPEAVYQALLAGGYDVRGVERDAVERLVARARKAKAPFSVSVADAFGTAVAESTMAGAAAGR